MEIKKPYQQDRALGVLAVDLRGRNDADRAATFLALDRKLYVPVNQCKQSVILADTNIRTGVKLGTALANNNVASDYQLAAVALYTESFRL